MTFTTSRDPAVLRLWPWFAIACLVITAPVAQAHGDDGLLIEALSEELAKAPDPDLFIRRGELFRHLQEWEKADADYAAAARLEPTLAVIDFFRARARLESGAPAKAEPLIERYVAAQPDEAEGWFLRGDVRASLGRHEAGASDYDEGLRRTRRARPEHFLRRARFLAAMPDADRSRVIASLDEGITRLGPVVSLIDYAIQLELERRNFDAALARIDLIMEHAPRREGWLVRRGDVLVSSGRAAHAIESYRAALSAIEELPERYRSSVPMEKLARTARDSLDKLAATGGSAAGSPPRAHPDTAHLR